MAKGTKRVNRFFIKYPSIPTGLKKITSYFNEKHLTSEVQNGIILSTGEKSPVRIRPLENYWCNKAPIRVLFFMPKFMVGNTRQLSSWQIPVFCRSNLMQPATTMIRPKNGVGFLIKLENIMEVKTAGVSASTYKTYQIIKYNIMALVIVAVALIL